MYIKERYYGLSTLCRSCRFDYRQRVLKTFTGPCYLRSKAGVLWLWHLLVQLYIQLTISSCYGSICFTLVLIGRDFGLWTMCHSCGFDYQQRMLKTIPGSGYLGSEDGVVWLCHLLVDLYIIWTDIKKIMHNTYVIEFGEQVFIYNEKTFCTSHTSCAQVFELPKSHFGNKQEGTLFSWLHMCYAHIASARFAHFVCHGYIFYSFILFINFILIWRKS